MRIGPQPGPQTEFLTTPADIAVYGGSAGGGKTFAELIEALRYINNPHYGAVIFRRTLKQVKDEGGIWDQAAELYPLLGAVPNLSERYWQFPSGAVVQFAGLEHEFSKFSWQGSQICLLEFDELTHFTEGQFWYMQSRNRSMCGERPYTRATTNPGPGWVKRLLAPWVDRTFSNPAKSGEIRWFVREGNKIVWLEGSPPVRTPCGCLKEGCESCFPPEKSLTFIRSSVYDNKILLARDPGYVANLMAMPELERSQLLYGDWDARPANLVLDGFDETRHVIPSGSIPSHWLKCVGADFGINNAAELAIAEDPDDKSLVVFGENWPGHSRRFEEQARDIRRICGGTPKIGVGGQKNEEGDRQALRKEGIPMEAPKYASVDLQYSVVNDAFRSNKLFIQDCCPVLIDMINRLERKVDQKGEVTDAFDDGPFHLAACLRYIVTRLRPPAPKQNTASKPMVIPAQSSGEFL